MGRVAIAITLDEALITGENGAIRIELVSSLSRGLTSSHA